MPAVRDVVVGIQVVEAVTALLVAIRLALEYGILGEMLELECQLLIDLFGLGRGQVVGHCRDDTSRLARRQAIACEAAARTRRRSRPCPLRPDAWACSRARPRSCRSQLASARCRRRAAARTRARWSR